MRGDRNGGELKFKTGDATLQDENSEGLQKGLSGVPQPVCANPSQQSLVPEKGKQFVFRNSRGRRYLIDTGASYHMAPFNGLTPAERRTIKEVAQPFPMRTANDVVQITHTAVVVVPD